MLDAAYAAYDRYAEVKTNEALCACAHTSINIQILIRATASEVSLVMNAAKRSE